MTENITNFKDEFSNNKSIEKKKEIGIGDVLFFILEIILIFIW